MFEFMARIALIAIIVIGLLAFWGRYLSPRDELEKVDAIVAISGGDTRARANEAARLYQDGWAGQIIFSGAALDPLSPSNAAVMREIAQDIGVPSNVIEIEEDSTDTRENASESREIAKKRNYHSVILVTSTYHQRRAYLEFQNKFGDEIKIINAPAEDKNWHRDLWWLSPYGWYLTLAESSKIILMSIRN